MGQANAVRPTSIAGSLLSRCSNVNTVSMLVSDIQTGKRAMLGCITDVEAWCWYRWLKLNADKSEVLWLGTRQQIVKLSPADNDLVPPTGTLSASSNAHNLGVTIDENLTFDVRA